MQPGFSRTLSQRDTAKPRHPCAIAWAKARVAVIGLIFISIVFFIIPLRRLSDVLNRG